MKIFNWSEDKNRLLLKERGLSFEEVVFAIMNGMLLDILEHPNKEQYADQRLYVVGINNYAYIVPFVESDNEIFLKTIFPSRKYTRIYFGKEGE